MRIMNRVRYGLLYGVIILITASCNQAPVGSIKIENEVVTVRAKGFSLDQVNLLSGPFLHAMELDQAVLLNYEPDRMLSKFYSEAGLTPKAEHYHGWEDATISGHTLGHYLSACALMYSSTGDDAFLERVNYIVDELKVVQDANGNGFAGAFPNWQQAMEEEVAHGIIRSQGFDLNGIWVPWYNLHKTMAGLRDAYRLCGNELALEINKGLGDWTGKIISGLSDEQMQEMMRCEYGGMNEVLADLYADTGDNRYLQFSDRFHHRMILDSLAEGRDILPGKHGNTNIPKLIGLARRYELTGDSIDRQAAEFFWERVVNHHSYVTGGNGNNEYWGKPDQLRDRLGQGTTETCNVYNMLKLTKHLFEWEAEAEKADFYERALINHILSSQHPDHGRVVYNLSLNMGGYKEYQSFEDFTCCVGTGMENHAKYGESIYYHNDIELFVNQYIASELKWKEKGLYLTQTTTFPDEQGTTLDFALDQPVKLSLQIRYPHWAQDGMTVKVNGRKVAVKTAPSSFVTIYRQWKDGDRVEITFPFTLRLEAMPDDPDRVTIFYGPLVLAGQLGSLDDPAAQQLDFVPVLRTESRNPADWLVPLDGRPNTFMMNGVGQPRDVELIPFYATHDIRYTIYWDIFNEESWQQRQADYEAELARKAQVERLTIDFVQPGEMQPERDHNFKGVNTTPGEFNDRKNREARSGWFSFDMKVLPDEPVVLHVEYWGGFPGNKTFEILVDGQRIAEENISNIRDGHWVNKDYPIPQELTRNRTQVTVKFNSFFGHMAGPVFGIRTLRVEPVE
ncbi:MAG: glycoside hydrolase family 127 protein [Bacteroidales bacterium]|nr:glycoside hydrolase family 127 protein [Bacteroidales bacterium]